MHFTRNTNRVVLHQSSCLDKPVHPDFCTLFDRRVDGPFFGAELELIEVNRLFWEFEDSASLVWLELPGRSGLAPSHVDLGIFLTSHHERLQ